jgi:hypothetical protein
MANAKQMDEIEVVGEYEVHPGAVGEWYVVRDGRVAYGPFASKRKAVNLAHELEVR